MKPTMGSPPELVRGLGLFLLWIATGVLSLFGALSYAEVGALLPRAGGQYVYLREAYGPVWAFLYGWTEFLVIRAGSLAALATAFALYAGHFIPLSNGRQAGGHFLYHGINTRSLSSTCVCVLESEAKGGS